MNHVLLDGKGQFLRENGRYSIGNTVQVQWRYVVKLLQPVVCVCLSKCSFISSKVLLSSKSRMCF